MFITRGFAFWSSVTLRVPASMVELWRTVPESFPWHRWCSPAGWTWRTAPRPSAPDPCKRWIRHEWEHENHYKKTALNMYCTPQPCQAVPVLYRTAWKKDKVFNIYEYISKKGTTIILHSGLIRIQTLTSFMCPNSQNVESGWWYL